MGMDQIASKRVIGVPGWLSHNPTCDFSSGSDLMGDGMELPVGLCTQCEI